MSQEELKMYFYKCVRCRYLVRAPTKLYCSPCPICRGLMIRDTAAERFFKSEIERGVKKHA